MALNKYENYYSKIKTEVTTIKSNFCYQNLSKAFAHWYMLNFRNIPEEDLGEIIIDGNGDNGIDAIEIGNSSIKIYQFKFPDQVKNIGKTIDETTVLKIINGYNKLTGSRNPVRAHANFLAFRKRISEETIFNYEFCFVGFTDTLSEPAKDALNNHINEIKNKYGNEIKYSVLDKKKICDLFDKKQKLNSVQLDLKYNSLTASYNVGEEVKSWMGFANAHDILDSCKDNMSIIFDENIRNYEGDNSVNNGIMQTASSKDESINFFFYHNGIVFICDKCDVSYGNNIASLKSAAIVNGCQTVVSLKTILDNGTLCDNVIIPVRIIETNDMELRSKITEYLNSQTKIKDSYFLANNTFIRKLQLDLLEKGYYLERLANEYEYKHSLNQIEEFTKDKVLSVEKVIQVFVAYYNNDYAATAKRGKSELFNKDIIDELISCISAEKVIEAYGVYRNICQIITKYRICKRVSRNDDFLKYLGYDVDMSDNDYNKTMDEYIFMNTADMLLLNIYKNIDLNLDFDDKIKEAIKICKEVVEKSSKRSNISSATKNSETFKNCREKAVKLTHEKRNERLLRV